MELKQDHIEQFRNRMSQVANLSEQCWDNFLRMISYRKLKANEYFSRELSQTKELGFIVGGLVRIFSVDEEGNEWNKSLLKANEFIMASLNPTIPSPVNIQVILPTDLFVIGYNDFMKLTLACPDLKNLIHLLSSQHLEKEKKRNNMLMVKKSADRLEHFKSEFPQIYGKIPKEQIASYIGIAKEDLKF